MRKFRNHLIGVMQGSQMLFSDFDNDGEMWTGSGPRESRTHIRFDDPFKTNPSVQVSMDMWDIDQKTNLRADISSTSITENGFTIVFKTWGNTKIARVRASWLAIGEAIGNDEWDIS